MLVSIFQLQRMKYKEFDRLVECAIDTSQWQLIYENMTNTTTRNSSNTISTFNLRELFAACGRKMFSYQMLLIGSLSCAKQMQYFIVFNSINKTTLTEQYVLSQLHMLYQITP
ncbi:unnamed protein product [Didymodactylos carnosus]|uniref:Uncharacterized protein n=1 Tax=Didymodactylos carnosus TaxID=1234261 RepID=A0A814GB95_9BILA|nr:unnamed protein product [Didymodactylos carnosus]CAF3763848.1 unnamed protein product [Didymodactylos carnosus]